MRVLLTSHGSTGDIYPVIRLGRALLKAGHEVRFTTVSFFREEVERAGLGLWLCLRTGIKAASPKLCGI